jgi:CCR4-NOT transcription complex subunit 6
MAAAWTPNILTYENCSSEETTIANFIRVVSLNCLAPSYVSEAGLPWLPKELLCWKQREQSLLQLIQQSNCDILCLQEFEPVDSKWEDTFNTIGYDFVFKARPGRKDGCATFWKRESFSSFAPPSVVDFNVLADLKNDFRFKRDNIALVLHLNSIHSNDKVVVVNTHLHWNPNKSDVKLAQAVMLSRCIKEACSLNGTTTPILLCGDLNSLPDSDVINFLLTGDVPVNIFEGNDRRFICDRSLNKLCRWLRILGIDCTLESAEEEEQRT